MKVLSARQYTAWRKKNAVPEGIVEKSFDNWFYTRSVEGAEIPDQYTEGVLVVWAVRGYSAVRKRRGTLLKALVLQGKGEAFEPHIGYVEKGVPNMRGDDKVVEQRNIELRALQAVRHRLSETIAGMIADRHPDVQSALTVFCSVSTDTAATVPAKTQALEWLATQLAG